MHIFQCNSREGQLSGGEQELFLLLECHGGDTGGEIVADAAGDLGKRIHGAGDDRRSIDLKRAAGDGGGDVVAAVQCYFLVLKALDGEGIVGDHDMCFDAGGQVRDKCFCQLYAAGSRNGNDKFHGLIIAKVVESCVHDVYIGCWVIRVDVLGKNGAGERDRTVDPNLGKVMLYR